MSSEGEMWQNKNGTLRKAFLFSQPGSGWKEGIKNRAFRPGRHKLKG